jgi:hypothetical protein
MVKMMVGFTMVEIAHVTIDVTSVEVSTGMMMLVPMMIGMPIVAVSGCLRRK